MEENNQPTKVQAKILLLDDSATILSILQGLLQPLGYALFCFANPKIALSQMDQISPDIIVSDLEMPDLHGFEFIHRIRANPKFATVPILILTSQTDTEAMSQSILLGADAFIAKDAVKFALQPQILSLLRLRQTYSDATRGKQLEAVQALIGTYKHEFGNTVTILEHKLRKILTNFPGIQNDPALEGVQTSIKRMKSTLHKLTNLQEYETTPYSRSGKIIKLA